MLQIENGIFYEDVYPGVTVGAILLPMGTILVDAPLRAEDGRAWLSFLAAQGANSNRVLVNLDAHPDRTLGARSMDCTIVAHQKTAQIFRGRPSVFKGQNAESGSEWETYDDVMGTRWATPDITFATRLCWHWGESDVVIEQYDGPAPGATWVIVPAAKVMFVGDVVMSTQPPFLTNSDLPAWIDTLGVLLESFRGYTIVGGREGIVSYEAVRNQQQHLKNILKSLGRLAKRNVAPEDVERLIPALLADLDFPEHLREQYFQRYRHGLYQYYTRCYRSVDSTND